MVSGILAGLLFITSLIIVARAEIRQVKVERNDSADLATRYGHLEQTRKAYCWGWGLLILAIALGFNFFAAHCTITFSG